MEIERVDVPTHGSLTTGVGSSNMQIFVNTLTRETITLDERLTVARIAAMVLAGTPRSA